MTNMLLCVGDSGQSVEVGGVKEFFTEATWVSDSEEVEIDTWPEASKV
jgi:hypothetical protein